MRVAFHEDLAQILRSGTHRQASARPASATGVVSSPLMGASVYHVHADWDPEADVWVATSADVPGLATEAPTIEALAEKLRTIIPELLTANEPRESHRLAGCLLLRKL